MSQDRTKISLVISQTLRALFYPKVIMTFFICTFGVLFFWSVLGILIWPFLMTYLGTVAQGSSLISGLVQKFTFLQSTSVTTIALFIFLILVGVPCVLISATILSSVLSSTYLIQYIGKKDFPDLVIKGESRVLLSLMNVLFYTAFFILISVVIIPIGWMLAIGPILSVVVTAWYNMKVGSFDVLTAWTTDGEFKTLRKQSQVKAYVVSLLASLTLFLPLTFLFAPVIVNMALTYYYLAKCEQLRRLTSA